LLLPVNLEESSLEKNVSRIQVKHTLSYVIRISPTTVPSIQQVQMLRTDLQSFLIVWTIDLCSVTRYLSRKLAPPLPICVWPPIYRELSSSRQAIARKAKRDVSMKTMSIASLPSRLQKPVIFQQHSSEQAAPSCGLLISVHTLPENPDSKRTRDARTNNHPDSTY